jgi:hypothetical protein
MCYIILFKHYIIFKYDELHLSTTFILIVYSNKNNVRFFQKHVTFSGISRTTFAHLKLRHNI